MSVRPAAVAGLFYPDDKDRLESMLAAHLAGDDEAPPPKAVIAPHAGYVYSGAVAGAIYKRLKPVHDRIERVVLIGPAHRVHLEGVAASGMDAFATPLGEVPVDRDGVASALAQPDVEINDLAHRDEHSLEVHLPFLQTVLDGFAVVPLVVGRDPRGAAAHVLDALWGGPETLVVVSSDLSHYHGYEVAEKMDAATCAAIIARDGAAIAPEQACGRAAITGLIAVARARRLAAETVAMCNSGDTAGPRDSVVGYGAWAFCREAAAESADSAAPAAANDTRSGGSEPPPRAAGSGVLARHGEVLLEVAARSIAQGLRAGRPLKVALPYFAPELRRRRASFVTLKRGAALRGCIGSLEAHRPLVEDVAQNAYSAAFRDPRFPALKPAEGPGLSISLSILSAPEPIFVTSEDELLAALRPEIDGLILHGGDKRGVFLPAVWKTIPEPRQFVRRLKLKAGLREDDWSADFRFQRFTTEATGPD